MTHRLWYLVQAWSKYTTKWYPVIDVVIDRIFRVDLGTCSCLHHTGDYVRKCIAFLTILKQIYNQNDFFNKQQLWNISFIILRHLAVYEAFDVLLLHWFFPLNPPNRIEIQRRINKEMLDTLSYSPFHYCIVSEKLNILLP